MPCQVVYFRLPSGRMPVKEFLDGIRDKKELAAILADLFLLSQEGPNLPFPLVSSIQAFAGLRELRTRFGGAQYRIVFVVTDGTVVALHAFRKTATSQARREYVLAAERARSLR